MRKLAHVEEILWTRPIENADNIELVGVLGWQCIAKKGELKVGDKCIYIEIDSIVDQNNPDFAFLENKHYKIKTMKMRGVLSQGIVFPLSILSSEYLNFNKDIYSLELGYDLTSVLKIKEIEDDIPKEKTVDKMTKLKQNHKKLTKNKIFMFFMRFKWFRVLAFKILLPKKKSKNYPSWIIKTDETRLQNMPFVLEQYANVPMIVTEKIDGTSTTFGIRKIKKLFGYKYEIVVCSRNMRQNDISQKCYFDDNVYHEMAKKYDVANVLIKMLKKENASCIVLQGETIGEAIQGNKYGLTGRDFYAFNLFIDGVKLDSTVATNKVNEYGIKWVPILTDKFILLNSVEEMIAYADGKSLIADTLREGLVIRDHKNTISFKCISNEFLLKHKI